MQQSDVCLKREAGEQHDERQRRVSHIHDERSLHALCTYMLTFAQKALIFGPDVELREEHKFGPS